MKKTMRVVLLQILIVAFLTTSVDVTLLAPRNVQAISLPTGMASAQKTTSAAMKTENHIHQAFLASSWT